MTSTPPPAPEAVVLQKDAGWPSGVQAHVRDVATVEFCLGLTVGIALTFAAVLAAQRVLRFRVRV